MDTKTSIVTFGNRRIRLDDIISYRIVKKSHTEVVKKTKEEYKRDMERYKRDNSLAKRAGYRVATSAKRVGGGVAGAIGGGYTGGAVGSVLPLAGNIIGLVGGFVGGAAVGASIPKNKILPSKTKDGKTTDVSYLEVIVRNPKPKKKPITYQYTLEDFDIYNKIKELDTLMNQK